MPGPTNPWATELKKTRRRSHPLKGKDGQSGSKEQDQSSSNPDSKDPVRKNPKKDSIEDANTKSLIETRENDTAKKEEEVGKAEVKKCVKVQDKTKKSAFKAKSPQHQQKQKHQQQPLTTSESSKSLYQDARSHLKPVAKILSRQLSQEGGNNSHKKTLDTDNPVDLLIEQGSIEQPVQGWSRYTLFYEQNFALVELDFHLHKLSLSAWNKLTFHGI